jgi:hypothetical protein
MVMDLTQVITVVITTSPIPSHPSTEVIDRVCEKIWQQLPGVRIVILADGVHPEETQFADRYAEYLSILAKRKSLTVYIAPSWGHQSGTLRWALIENNFVSTPLILFTDHDRTFTDRPIPWQGLTQTLLDGQFVGVRFQADAGRKSETEFGTFTPHGIPVVRITQYLNWPTLNRTDYFTEFVDSFGAAKTFLEISESDGFLTQNFERFPYCFYNPVGDCVSSTHLNGREFKATPEDKARPRPYMEFSGYRRRYGETDQW